MTYTQAKECIQELGREGLEELINRYGDDVINAAFGCDVPVKDIAEAYQGEYKDDEEFVQQLLEDTGDVPQDLPPYIHIDWEWTAREIMMDYHEDNGHYFRCL